MNSIEIFEKENGETSYSCDNCGDPHDELIYLGNARIDLCHKCFKELKRKMNEIEE